MLLSTIGATDSGKSPQEQKQSNTEIGRERERGQHIRAYERLREELSPAYEALLKNVVAESDDGVRFVVDLRQVWFFIGRMRGDDGAAGCPVEGRPCVDKKEASLESNYPPSTLRTSFRG